MATVNFETLGQLFSSADSAWEEYASTVKQSLLEWEKIRPVVLERIAVLKTRISSNLKEIEEIQVKIELGLLDEEKSSKKINVISEETVRMIHELENIWLNFEETTFKSLLHMRRVGIPLDLTPQDVHRKIENVERSFKEGIISSKDVYERLKKILADELNLVEGRV
ncbi:MAG: hypothetical protein ABWK01_03115 [Infirmifilum sp.]